MFDALVPQETRSRYDEHNISEQGHCGVVSRHDGVAGEADAQLNPKKKVFEELAPSLRTDADGFAVYQVPAAARNLFTLCTPNAVLHHCGMQACISGGTALVEVV